jgi:hypothetical protein
VQIRWRQRYGEKGGSTGEDGRWRLITRTVVHPEPSAHRKRSNTGWLSLGLVLRCAFCG